jgi:hypothetical protein
MIIVIIIIINEGQVNLLIRRGRFTGMAVDSPVDVNPGII